MAGKIEFGPGSTSKCISLSMHVFTSTYPGSEIHGVPASVTRAIEAPSFKSEIIFLTTLSLE